MANLTIDEATTNIRQQLADTSAVAASQRWTDANILVVLADALSQCLTEYARAGGDRFDLEASVTTSATTGAISLASITPLLVKQVGVVVGNTTYRLTPKSAMRRGYPDLAARTLTVLYVQEYALSTTTAHPLVGVGATAANSWRAFDRWVWLTAARMLAPKDMEIPRIQLLSEDVAKAGDAALLRASTPSGAPMPRPEWNPVYGEIAWQVVQSTPTLYLTRVRG